jgi:hypothetical protein
VNEKAFGVRSCALVVIENVADPVPIVMVTVVCVLNEELEVPRAATTKVPVPLVATLFDEANVPLNEVVPASTVPPDADTVIVKLGSKPVTVTVPEVVAVLSSTPFALVNEKLFGIVSAALVVIVQLRLTVPTVTVTVVEVEKAFCVVALSCKV